MCPPIVAPPPHPLTQACGGSRDFVSGETCAQTFVSKIHGDEQGLRTRDFPLDEEGISRQEARERSVGPRSLRLWLEMTR